MKPLESKEDYRLGGNTLVNEKDCHVATISEIKGSKKGRKKERGRNLLFMTYPSGEAR